MNGVLRSAVVGPRAAPLWSTPVSSFHSTPSLERRRRSHWHSRFNYYEKRKKKMESKRTLVRNLGEYAEYLFQSWREESAKNSSVHEEPWFRRNSWTKAAMKNGFGEPQSDSYRNKRNGAFEFCTSDDDDDDDDDVGTIFRSAFGGARFSYGSFNDSQDFRWNSSGHRSHRSSRSWTYETDDEIDASTQQEFISERLALGLRTSGPLKLEEVKNAYRSCALKWHPDRHQGSSKEAAAEKFKNCSAAYQTLCDKLAMG